MEPYDVFNEHGEFHHMLLHRPEDKLRCTHLALLLAYMMTRSSFNRLEREEEFITLKSRAESAFLASGLRFERMAPDVDELDPKGFHFRIVVDGYTIAMIGVEEWCLIQSCSWLHKDGKIGAKLATDAESHKRVLVADAFVRVLFGPQWAIETCSRWEKGMSALHPDRVWSLCNFEDNDARIPLIDVWNGDTLAIGAEDFFYNRFTREHGRALLRYTNGLAMDWDARLNLLTFGLPINS